MPIKASLDGLNKMWSNYTMTYIQHMLQRGQILRTRCGVKEAKHKGPHVVYFHLYEMSKAGKSVERESRVAVV